MNFVLIYLCSILTTVLDKKILSREHDNELDMQNIKIHIFVPIICHLKLLTRLNLTNTRIFEIPEKIENLQNLKFLNLSRNKIDKLPKSIGKLQKLKNIDISCNKLKSLPCTFSDLKLKNFYCKKNMFKEFPIEILNMSSLIVIDMSKNQIKTVCTLHLPFLKILNISYNAIEEIPIVKSTNLILLNLNGNLIKELTIDLCKIKSLKKLLLCENIITKIETYVLEFCDQLELLDLRDNYISDLADDKYLNHEDLINWFGDVVCLDLDKNIL
ncbi:leucine-rich repeat containing protein [Vairimorpha apis BRL 01]|uniref:Leucine-rich repeat containing protein n=1 Tax=Vairimorpha apis BRL 01 TaxID=1037528 RepID=T0L7Y2_9MICR|nr:leucine-rich repeat containing protein [Vairimorpha apis BRL 01]